MKIIVQNTAHKSIDSLFEHIANYSVHNAIQTVTKIYEHIYDLERFPYIGRHIPEIPDNKFRELIYKKSRKMVYKIVYYISESTNTIRILYVVNSKQDFNHILKIHNYFNNYSEL